MLNLIERFKKRQTLVVEGEWYLIEVQQGGEVDQWVQCFDDAGKQRAMEEGYRLTPVTIFRKEQV